MSLSLPCEVWTLHIAEYLTAREAAMLLMVSRELYDMTGGRSVLVARALRGHRSAAHAAYAYLSSDDLETYRSARRETDMFDVFVAAVEARVRVPQRERSRKALLSVRAATTLLTDLPRYKRVKLSNGLSDQAALKFYGCRGCEEYWLVAGPGNFPIGKVVFHDDHCTIGSSWMKEALRFVGTLCATLIPDELPRHGPKDRSTNTSTGIRGHEQTGTPVGIAVTPRDWYDFVHAAAHIASRTAAVRDFWKLTAFLAEEKTVAPSLLIKLCLANRVATKHMKAAYADYAVMCGGGVHSGNLVYPELEPEYDAFWNLKKGERKPKNRCFICQPHLPGIETPDAVLVAGGEDLIIAGFNAEIGDMVDRLFAA